jgi:hypothetical protein
MSIQHICAQGDSSALQETRYNEQPNADEGDGIPAPQYDTSKLGADRLSLAKHTSQGRYHTTRDSQDYDQRVVRE